MKIYTSKVGVEVPLFLLAFAAMVADPVTKHFVIFRTCYVIFGYNEMDCSKLGTIHQTNETHQIEKVVEPDANIILMTINLMCLIIPAILCIFIGPWSDKNGRRPILLITLAGFAVGHILKAVITMIPNASPWFLLLEGIPAILSGGFPALSMATLCYVTDITTSENRGMRLAIWQCIVVLGMLLGTLSSSFIYSFVGYTGTFIITSSCMLLALAFVYFLVAESVVKTGEKQDTSIFSLEHLKEMIKTTLKNRENYKRTILLLSILSMNLYVFAVRDEGVVFFYMREKFQWTLQQYTLYSTVRSILFILGTVVGVYVLHKLLRISETSLLIIGFSVLTVGMMLQGLAQYGWQIYSVCAIRSLGGVISPMLRSLISKIVPADEIGKIFSLTVAMESLVVLISHPVYTFIYNTTITTFSGAFNILSAGVYLIEVVIVLAIIRTRRIQDKNIYHEI